MIALHTFHAASVAALAEKVRGLRSDSAHDIRSCGAIAYISGDQPFYRAFLTRKECWFLLTSVAVFGSAETPIASASPGCVATNSRNFCAVRWYETRTQPGLRVRSLPISVEVRPWTVTMSRIWKAVFETLVRNAHKASRTDARSSLR